jgi:hypothetical protein
MTPLLTNVFWMFKLDVSEHDLFVRRMASTERALIPLTSQPIFVTQFVTICKHKKSCTEKNVCFS